MVSGMSESLAHEVAAWNIRVLIVQPAAFRTNFLAAFVPNEKGLSSDYKGTVIDETIGKFSAASGKQPGDPVKGSQIIVDVVTAECKINGEKVLRLPYVDTSLVDLCWALTGYRYVGHRLHFEDRGQIEELHP